MTTEVSVMLAILVGMFGLLIWSRISAWAIFMAGELNANPAPFIAILMLGSSYAFINPAGYQTNLMVMQPGRYRFFDYVKLGVPLTAVAGGTALVLTPLIWRL